MQVRLEPPGLPLALERLAGQRADGRAGAGGDSCVIQFKQEKAITFDFMQVMAGGQRIPRAVAARSVAPDHLGAERARPGQ